MSTTPTKPRNPEAIGYAIAKLLHLRKRRGRYDTTWGTFTETGLGNVVSRIIDEMSGGDMTQAVIGLLPPTDKL